MEIWGPGELYRIGEVVKHGEKIYRCNKEHVSQIDFDKFRFDKIRISQTDDAEEIEINNGQVFTLITSMDKEYYNHCGKAMLQSYKRHATNIGTLYVYNEQLFEPKVKGVEKAGWNLGSEFVKFHRRHTNSKIKTFSKKAFPIIDAMDRFKCDRLVWVDADCIFVNNMPRMLLELISPDDVLSTHFSVWHQKNDKEYHSCETGFFILNKNHSGYREFCDLYADIYYNDRDKELDLRRFYDGEVYGKCVEIMEAKGHKMLNLNPAKHKTPISRSVIAPYIEHYKAGLKDKVDFATLQDDEV